MNNELPERLEKIESHMATLERQVDQLNEVVVEQAGTITKLKTQIRRLSETIENLEIDRIKSTNAKPPHYHQ